jgi:hypothetical protein
VRVKTYAQSTHKDLRARAESLSENMWSKLSTWARETGGLLAFTGAGFTTTVVSAYAIYDITATAPFYAHSKITNGATSSQQRCRAIRMYSEGFLFSPPDLKSLASTGLEQVYPA